MGAILKKSVDWSDTDVILPGESIDKAMVSLQIQEVLNDERYKYFNAKNLNRQNDCIVSNPRIFKMKRYKYFYSKKFESTKQLYRFKTQNLLAMKQYNYFYYYFLGGWVDSQI